MAIGAAIQRFCPAKSAEDLREAVFAGARSAVLRHFTDMKSFISTPDYNVLFRLIKKNKLSLEDLEDISAQYNQIMKERQQIYTAHPFCSLFKMGLLGVPDTNFAGEKCQRFQAPDDLVNDETESILPETKVFFIHPSLDLMINNARSGDYRLNFDRKNIVGNGLAWKDSDATSYVLIGDVVKSSEWMQSPEVSNVTPKLFADWAEEACAGLAHHEVSKGDSVTMIDGSPALLLRAASILSKNLKSLQQMPRQIRFGATSGIIQFESEEGKRVRAVGIALLRAGRLEPHASPDCVIADDGFVAGAIEFGVAAAAFNKLESVDLPQLPFENDQFVISKSTDSSPTKSKLWSIKINN